MVHANFGCCIAATFSRDWSRTDACPGGQCDTVGESPSSNGSAQRIYAGQESGHAKTYGTGYGLDRSSRTVLITGRDHALRQGRRSACSGHRKYGGPEERSHRFCSAAAARERGAGSELCGCQSALGGSRPRGPRAAFVCSARRVTNQIAIHHPEEARSATHVPHDQNDVPVCPPNKCTPAAAAGPGPRPSIGG